jgi:hypothetical protein
MSRSQTLVKTNNSFYGGCIINNVVKIIMMGTTDHTDTSARRPRRKSSLLPVGLSLLLVITLGVCGYLYFAYQKAVSKNPAEEKRRIITQVSKLVVLPQEDPTIATVRDGQKLASKLLSKKTDKGDRLLIYNKARRIVVYRPAIGKVVDMFTINDVKNRAP